MRENHPGLFKSKYVNFGWYGMLSMKNAVGHWQHMKDILHLVVSHGSPFPLVLLLDTFGLPRGLG